MTLHLTFPLYTSQGIKASLKNKVTEQDRFQESLVPPCLSFFLSLTLFFRLIPWSTGALRVHLFAWASKTWTGRRSASSLPLETGRVPAAYVNSASSLSWGFIGFLGKPRYISFFFLLYSPYCKFFPYLSLYLYLSLTTLSTVRTPWIQLGLDPGSIPLKQTRI